MPSSAMSSQSPAAADAALVERYLAHARVQKRLAARTLTLYRLDLDKLAQLAVRCGGMAPRRNQPENRPQCLIHLRNKLSFK